MVLKKKEHQAFLLQALDHIQFPGNLAELVVEIKTELKDAEIEQCEDS